MKIAETYIITGLSTILLALPVTAIAQKLPNPDETEHIVVTGTRTAKLLNNSPVLVEVTDGETIAKISHGTLAQALNYIPGIVVKRSVKDGYKIQMQGFDSDHVLVLVNGQPVISPTGSSADLDQISASNIAQIEVIRGAASVMYGSSAMGGVINIITHKTDESMIKFDYDISQYHGNTINDGDLNHTFKIHAVDMFSDWRTQFNALIIDDKGYDYSSNTVNQDAANVKKKMVSLSTSKNHENIATNFKYQWLEDQKLRDSKPVAGWGNIISYQTDATEHQIDIGINSIKAVQSPWHINVRHIDHQETSGYTNSLRETDITLTEINGQKVFQLNNIELVTGAVAHVDKLNQYRLADGGFEIDHKSKESIEIFTQGNWVKEEHQLLAGVRIQYDSNFGWHQAMRFSAMKNVTLDNGILQWRAGIGQSYRVPNLKERFYIFDHSQIGYLILGNKFLEPETADSVNLSLTYNSTLADDAIDLRSDISVHYSKTKNLIDPVINSKTPVLMQPSVDEYEYQNINEAKIHGFDISTELKLNQWQMQLNYSYLTSENENNQRLLSRPRHQVKLNINYDLDDYDIELIGYAVYQVGEAVPNNYQVINNEYITVNAVMNQILTDKLSWHISVDNIFDQHKSTLVNNQNGQYSQNNQALFDARPVSSRMINVGISYEF